MFNRKNTKVEERVRHLEATVSALRGQIDSLKNPSKYEIGWEVEFILAHTDYSKWHFTGVITRKYYVAGDWVYYIHDGRSDREVPERYVVKVIHKFTPTKNK